MCMMLLTYIRGCVCSGTREELCDGTSSVEVLLLQPASASAS
eukprot:GSA25T00016101001.1